MSSTTLTLQIQAPDNPKRLSAGVVPGPVSTPIDEAASCPKYLSGYCRDNNRCTKGLHGVHLIKEVEDELAREKMTCDRYRNQLLPTKRMTGTSTDNSVYHTDRAGSASLLGVRHDNDFVEVADIGNFPTTDEILSKRLANLPKKDEAIKQNWGTSDERLRIHCGTLFRHLRFDICEPVIDCVYVATQMMVSTRHRPEPEAKYDYTYHKTTAQGHGFNYFHGVELEDISFHEYNGMQVRLSYTCPFALRDDGMRLSTVFESGKLCTLIAVNTATDEIYTVFMETYIRHSTMAMKHKTADNTRAAVIFKLAETENTQKARELVWLLKLAPSTMKFALVDLPGVLMAGSIYHLNRLRDLSTMKGDPVPFVKNIMAHAGSNEKAKIVERPAYSRGEKEIKWVLNGLRKDLADVKPFILNSQDKEAAMTAMQAQSTLDVGQAAALYDNLTREVAFTQGPPGTGKSFLGIGTVKVLVDSVSREDRGPIIVVAQTNHALDELLEGLKAKGIENICRFGSRSKSTKLEASMLKNLRRKHQESCQESTHRREAEDRTKGLLADGVVCCEIVGAMDKILARFQDMNINPDPATDTSGTPSDEPSSGDDAHPPFRRGPPRVMTSRKQIEADRKKETRAYIKTLSPAAQCDALVEIHRRHVKARASLADARRLKDLHILQHMDVIGMTTTACAREVELIKQLKPKILVIEEASEVLEAHTICALVPSIEHKISIGDPLQLRPHVGASLLNTEYNTTYRLNEPLFERLIGSGLPYAKLSIQRRAHPELATLIQVTDYPYVVNHDTTLDRAAVLGMASRLQWHNHNNEEILMKPGDGLLTDSWANPYEADMAVNMAIKFVKYLGYGPGEVVIITPYNGQLALITKKLLEKDVKLHVSCEDKEELVTGGYMSRKDLCGTDDDGSVSMADVLRVATLDNFQGEEAKIVILSTVRSNKSGKIGFLKTSNRINVAVSRAKEGFFVVGNADILRKNSVHWAKIVKQFEKVGALKKGFEATCRYHPAQKILVDSVKAAEDVSDWINFGCVVCNSW